MNTRAVLCLLLTACLAACATNPPQHQSTDVASSVDALDRRFAGTTEGTWQGSFDITSPTPEPATLTLTLCLTISKNEVHASTFEDGIWTPLKPLTAKSLTYGPSMLFYSLDGGETPGGGPWIEAWTIAFTVISPDTGVARTSRLVNNVDVPLEHPDRAFSFGGEGQMKLVQACH